MQDKRIEITEKGIGLSEWEFSILCNVCSIQDIVCFENKEKDPNPEECLQTLLDMVKRGILLNSEDTFSLSPDILLVANVIAGRKFTLLMQSSETEVPDCCIYVGDGENAVLAEPGAREGEYVILKVLPKNVLGVFIENGGYIPKAEIDEEINEIRRKVEGTDSTGVEFSQVDEGGPSKYRFKANVYAGSEDQLATSLYVIWDNGNELLLEISGNEKTADYYEESRLHKRILQLIEAV